MHVVFYETETIMGNDRWGEKGGGGGGAEGVNSIINTCLFVYCSLLGIFCTENIVSKKMVKY